MRPRPAVSTEAELAWAPSSFIRSSIFWIVLVAPSAICSTELACSAFFDACDRARVSARSLFAMPRPAASSAARLIRKPDDSFCIELATALFVSPRFRYAFRAEMLVLKRMVGFPPRVSIGASVLRRVRR